MLDRKVNNAIIVFAKLPVEGKVKTRLAKDLGNKLALSFYKVCAENTFNELIKLKQHVVDLFLFCTEESELEQIKKWAGDSFNYYCQRGNNLGKRMYNAFDSVFKIGYKKVILVGTDTPDINEYIIRQALSNLEKADCVLGPANDGGYYLIGLNTKVIDLFSGIKWSSNSVLERTEKKLKQEGVTYLILNEMIDIDTSEDLKYWLTNYTGGENHPVKIFVDSMERFFI